MIELVRVVVQEREPVDRLIGFEEVDRAPVRLRRHDQGRQTRERRPVVERGREDRAGFRQARERRRRALVVVDVGARADPRDDFAHDVAHRDRAPQVPAMVAVLGVQESVERFVVLLGMDRAAPPADEIVGILGMEHDLPAVLAQDVVREAGELEGAPVAVGEVAFGVGHPHDLRHRLGQFLVALFAEALLLGHRADPLALLVLAQDLALAPELLVLAVEIDEDRDLQAQDVRTEGLRDVVDGADVVAAKDLLLLLVRGGQEDDGGVPRPLALLDRARGLEAVEPRHHDVEEDHRELLVEQVPERLLARLRAHEVLPQRLQDRLEGEQVLGPVIDQQDVRGDLGLGAHEGVPAGPGGAAGGAEAAGTGPSATCLP